jgi:hypothetical protein
MLLDLAAISPRRIQARSTRTDSGRKESGMSIKFQRKNGKTSVRLQIGPLAVTIELS